MEEQYYWIEIKFPIYGFWGTVFKLWEEVKRIKEKVIHKTKFYIFKLFNKKRIRNPT